METYAQEGNEKLVPIRIKTNEYTLKLMMEIMSDDCLVYFFETKCAGREL